MHLQTTDTQPWYKEPWPWLLMVGPFAVIIAGVVTVWLAIRSYDGLVADDYYKQGLAINQRLQRDHKAGELGLRGELMRSGMQLRVLLRGSDQSKLPTTLSLRIMHPTRAGMDQSLILKGDGQGVFGGKLDADISGRWNAVLEDASGQWRLHGSWQSDAEEPLLFFPESSPSNANHNANGR